jgi:hypothetical protein
MFSPVSNITCLTRYIHLLPIYCFSLISKSAHNILHIEDLTFTVHFQTFQTIILCSSLMMINGIDYEPDFIAMVNNSSYSVLIIYKEGCLFVNSLS